VSLIALGTGKAGNKTLLGGTAIKVLRNSKIPVLTSKKSNKPQKLKRIIVPLDASRGLTKSFEYAAELAKKFNSTIDFVHIFEYFDYRLPDGSLNKIKASIYGELRDICGRNPLKGATPFDENVNINVVKDKNAWRGIVNFTRKTDADLISMMSYGGMRYKGEFLGSTAQKVIQEAPCPVLTMNP